jgi:hypothetical protein
MSRLPESIPDYKKHRDEAHDTQAVLMDSNSHPHCFPGVTVKGHAKNWEILDQQYRERNYYIDGSPQDAFQGFTWIYFGEDNQANKKSTNKSDVAFE